MTYGFKSISSAGFVQIDDLYSNYTLLQSGTASGNFGNISFPAVSGETMALVKIGIGHVFDIINGSSGGNYEYRIYARNQDIPAAINNGIKVFSPSGAVVFDSGVRKVQVATASYGLFSTSSSPITLPSPGYHPYFAIAGASGVVGAAIAGQFTALLGPRATQNADLSVTFQVQQVGQIPGFIPFSSPPTATNKPLMVGQ
jgi:hypothetical protein